MGNSCAGGSVMTDAVRERQRLDAVERYAILDTAPETEFDDIVALAAQICGMPIALITFIDGDRQWFKARVGVEDSETPREIAFCAHALHRTDVLLVPDLAQDERFAANPLVTGETNVRFYAGAPLQTPDGHVLGTLCVLDQRPRELDAAQVSALQRLARQVMTQLELRRALGQQREADDRHRLIVDSAIDYGIISMDLAGIVTSWNVGAERLTGWTEAEMCGCPCDRFFTPEDRRDGVPEREMASALAIGRGTDERWHLRKNGSQFWASGEMMPLVSDVGEPIGYLKILRDRTAQRAHQEALEDSEARVRGALEAGELGAWQSTPALKEMTWDARTRELLGHSPDEPLDYETSFLARVHPDDRQLVIAANAAALAPGGTGTTDMQYRTISLVDGKERWIHAKGAIVQSRDGQRFAGTVRDISAEKEAETQRRLLTAELEHRIKNTLAVVQAIVSQSLRGVATPDEARDAIAERLATLSHAHDILTQASWQAAPLSQIARASTQSHGADQDRIRINGPDVQLSAKAALAFSMFLHELSTNAAKYGALSNEAGHVELSWATCALLGGDVLDLKWREFDGPPVSVPERQGFGSRLMAGLSRDMGGKSEIEFRPEGVIWSLRSQLSKISV